MRKLVPVAVAALVAVLVVAAIAVASIPDSSGVIHTCYKTAVATHGSPLKVIDSATGSCASGYTELSWDQHGVIASGQANSSEGASACTWGGGVTYCNPNYSGSDPVFNNAGPSTQMTFTAAENGYCQVNFDGQVSSDQADGAFVQYGVAQFSDSTNTIVDNNDLTSTPGPFGSGSIGDYNAATISRSFITPVTADTEYTFEPWIEPSGDDAGTFYFNENFVCWSA
jgi:hypothetical protein